MDDQRTNRPHGGVRFRKLRIAFSAMCGIICLLLIVLWVRSYWWADALWYRTANNAGVRAMSDDGAITVWTTSMLQALGSPPPQGWSHRVYWHEGYVSDTTNLPWYLKVFRGFYSEKRFTWQVPYWLFVSMSMVAGGLIWNLHWSKRFSLRTALIGMTVVAVLLGAVAWAGKI